MAATPGAFPSDDDPSTFKFTDDDGAPAVLPETGAGGEQSKVRVVLGLLKKLIGVSDVANLRLSLPASLLEPIPNLEYWVQTDRADFFAAIGQSDDELERMLSVLRFSFSKELKFVRARLGKPYNSCLGEHFRCHYYVPPALVHPTTSEPIVRAHLHDPSSPDVGPIWSEAGTPVVTPLMGSKDVGDGDNISVRSLGPASSAPSSPSPAPIVKKSTPVMPKLTTKKSGGKSKKGKNGDGMEALTNGVGGLGVGEEKEVAVLFLCEQVSHHPPISAAYYSCPARGVEMVGMDQIAAKVSGMTIQVGPGAANKGLFVTLKDPSPGKGEEYHITNPLAQVNGILKGAYYGTISDKVYVTCSGGKEKATKLRTIIEYKDESWIGKPRFMLEGVIYAYTPGTEEENYARIKQVPADKVVGHIEGVWRKQVKWRRKGEKEWRVLIDLDILDLVPKRVQPIEEQHEMESRRLWDQVTKEMLAKNWGEATKQKQLIEQRQRDRATELKRKGEEHKIVHFSPEWVDGRPKLSDEGRKAIDLEFERAQRTSAPQA